MDPGCGFFHRRRMLPKSFGDERALDARLLDLRDFPMPFLR